MKDESAIFILQAYFYLTLATWALIANLLEFIQYYMFKFFSEGSKARSGDGPTDVEPCLSVFLELFCSIDHLFNIGIITKHNICLSTYLILDGYNLVGYRVFKFRLQQLGLTNLSIYLTVA